MLISQRLSFGGEILSFGGEILSFGGKILSFEARSLRYAYIYLIRQAEKEKGKLGR